jgi:TPR repeat protein
MRELRIRAALIVLLSLESLAASATDDSWGAIIRAETRGDYATAIRIYRSLAEQGNATAQGALGDIYLFGELGVPPAEAEGTKWLYKAAAQGDVHAQERIAGILYRKESFQEAAKWYRKAAERGHNQEFTKGGGSALWSETRLGEMFGDGRGVPQDTVAAFMWFNLAAGNSFGGGEDVVRARVELAKKMTPEQIAEAQRLSREWIAQHQ